MDVSEIISGLLFIVAVAAFVVHLEIKCRSLEEDNKDDP